MIVTIFQLLRVQQLGHDEGQEPGGQEAQPPCNQDSGKHHGAEAGQVKLGVQVYGPKVLGGNESRSQGGRHLSQTQLCLFFATLPRPAPWVLFPGRPWSSLSLLPLQAVQQAQTNQSITHPPSNEPWIPEVQ